MRSVLQIYAHVVGNSQLMLILFIDLWQRLFPEHSLHQLTNNGAHFEAMPRTAGEGQHIFLGIDPINDETLILGVSVVAGLNLSDSLHLFSVILLGLIQN